MLRRYDDFFAAVKSTGAADAVGIINATAGEHPFVGQEGLARQTPAHQQARRSLASIDENEACGIAHRRFKMPGIRVGRQ